MGSQLKLDVVGFFVFFWLVFFFLFSLKPVISGWKC